MSFITVKTFVIFGIAFVSGIAAANLPSAIAGGGSAPDLSKRSFTVFIDEVKQNIVFGEQFTGSYSTSITLSDGSKREVTLTPMVHNGMQVVELKDTGGLTYMSLSGTTTNGKLMIQVKDNASSQAALKAQGWN